MFCTKCGTEFSDGTAFCRGCGNPIAGKVQEGVCLSCGVELPDNAAFCHACGNPVIVWGRSAVLRSTSCAAEPKDPLAEPDWCTFEDGSIPYPDPEQTVFFEEVEYGKRIPFDDDELLFIDRRTRSFTESFAGKEFHTDTAKTMWCGIVSPELSKMVQVRLEDGDIDAALSTCIKLLAACPYAPSNWVLLSEIFAQKGEHEKAQACLGEARRRESLQY